MQCNTTLWVHLTKADGQEKSNWEAGEGKKKQKDEVIGLASYTFDATPAPSSAKTRVILHQVLVHALAADDGRLSLIRSHSKMLLQDEVQTAAGR